ncbi:hypothetical protein wcw_0392 [Waddlia chondrophila WSU 86-1044]|uniref:Uncharacterized protein n=1 Tax=Waddlia chondrophila (strain ATCC VR-1470 / WSU 86-1044) TaxID=716544 RepID=D6YUF3_WADCW|nr:hypothetical protein wcw_0392 [Waddlia chondrophila WSU 86-1044]
MNKFKKVKFPRRIFVIVTKKFYNRFIKTAITT